MDNENLIRYTQNLKNYIENTFNPLKLELDDNVTIATLKIDKDDSSITFKNLTGMTKIAWGDDSVDNKLSHTYKKAGTYNCKIYGVTKLGKEAFYQNKYLTSIKLGSTVTELGQGALRGTGITELNIPSSVTTIGTYALDGCTALTKVEINNNITETSFQMFGNCAALKNVVLPSSLLSIGEKTFMNCAALESISIPSSVTSIGRGAISGCKALTNIVIPQRVTTLGDRPFYQCTNLKIYCERTAKPDNWDSTWNSDRPVVWGYRHKDYPEVITELAELKNNKLDNSNLSQEFFDSLYI